MPVATDTIDRRARKNRQWCRGGLLAGWIGLAAALMSAPAAGAADSAPSKLVVVLYPEPNDGSPGSVLAERGLRAALAGASDGNVDIHSEHLDVSTSAQRQDRQESIRLLRRRYAGRKVDLVIAGLSSTLNFTLEHRDEMFPGVPLVFMAVDREEIAARQMPPDVIGVPVEMDLAGSLAAALRLLPQTKRVVVVVGSSPFDAFWEAKARSTFPPAGREVQVEYLVGLPMDELLSAVAQLPDHSLIYYLHVMEDRDGRVYMPAMVVERMAARANAPIFGHVDSYLGRGMVGGRVFSFEQAGRDAGRLGARILAGEDPAAIGIQPAAGSSYLFDWRQLDRWGIPTASLPPGSEIRYRQPTLWERYRWQMSGLAALVGIQALLIAGLLVQRSRRARAEHGQRQVEQQLRESHEELRRLAAQILGAQEAERRRIARELHDDFGQDLALVSVELDLLRQRLSKSPEEAEARILSTSDRVKQLSSSIHDLSHQLHPMKLEQLGLVAALGSLSKELGQNHAVQVEFAHRDIPATLSQEVAFCLYRVAQEALRNVVKHSGAASASASLVGRSGSLALEIRDNGRGFDPTTVVGQGGLGLVSMRERLRLVGGELTVESQPGAGTRLLAQVPLGTAASANVQSKSHAASR
jgi:signal transduction histidine kinase